MQVQIYCLSVGICCVLILSSRGRTILSINSMVITCKAVIRCKAANKCLNVHEQAKIVEMNENGHIRFYKRKPR